MKTWRRYCWHACFGWIGLVILSVCFGYSVQAAETAAEETETVTITLRNLLFSDQETLDQQQIMGEELLQEYTGIDGTSFELVNVTHAYTTFIKENPNLDITKDKAKQQFIASISSEVLAASAKIQATTHTVNGVSGQADFQVNPKTEGRDSVFLLQATENDTAPILIVLPIIDAQGDVLNRIFVYVKQVKTTEVPPGLIKTLADPKDSYQYGDKVTFETRITIPSTIPDAESLVLTDAPDEGLTVVMDTVKVAFDSEMPRDTYQISQEGRGFSVTFSAKYLQDHIGESVTITYQMNLNGTRPNVSYFENQATLWLNDVPILKDKKGIFTGGKHFIKSDADNQQALQGATFLIKNQAGDYLAQTDQGYRWGTSNSDMDHASFVTLISDDKGLFAINGLTYGTYFLEEKSAPTGYTKNRSAIAFEVARGTYEASDQVLTIVNKKTTQPEKQKPSGKLPQTDERNDSKLMLVGIVMILLIGCIQMRREKE